MAEVRCCHGRSIWQRTSLRHSTCSRLVKYSRTKLRTVEITPKVFIMPYLQNRRFTGREDLLLQLREKLCEENQMEYNHRVAIYGLGGVGKSQIAIEYVYRYKQNYTNIYWINASDQASLLSGFQKIGIKTKCVENVADLKPTEVAEVVCLWLPQQESWLLIIDNLDDFSVVDDYLPDTHKGGHMLITTRNR